MKRLIVIVVVVLALGGLFAFGLLRGQPDSELPSVLLGRPAPTFELPLYERYRGVHGETFDLAQHVGTPMVVNFWASWCPPCYEEAPVLQTYWEEFQDAGVLFFGIQTQDRQARAEGNAFLDQFDLTFPNGIDDDSRVSVEWGLYGVPETYFIDRDGKVAYRLAGPVTPEILDRQLAAILR